MSDPRRLIEDERGDAFELKLLRAARAYQAPHRVRKRTLAVLGAAGLLGASKITVGLAGAAGALSAKSWIVMGVLSVAGAGGGAVFLSKRPLAPKPQGVSLSSPAKVPAVHPSLAPQPPLVPPISPPLSPAPPVRRLPTRPATPPAAGAVIVAPPSAPSLTDELALLDRARTAARRQNLALSHSTLDEFERRFPRGALSQEAAVVRIEALISAGSRSEAVRRAEAFFLAYPRSVLSPRIRTLIAATHP